MEGRKKRKDKNEKASLEMETKGDGKGVRTVEEQQWKDMRRTDKKK